jgi:hypothetical protein
MLAFLAAIKSASWAMWLYQNRAWLKWLAIGLVFAAIVGLWRWERHDRIAAQTIARAATERLALAQQDAARWQQASNLRDAAITELKTVLDAQSTAVERWRLSSERADTAARLAAETDRRNRAAADARVRELMEEARARPEAVRPLGPLVLGRVDGLFD